MQPRFSPDGKRIAFTSDRDGLWNIWTMDLDGKNAKQISREKRWFINSPTWSPDGDYIYARRHFVAERSLGAGEIWMYHSSGPSDGLQVTERDRLPEGQRRARHLAGRPLPLLQQGRHAGARRSNTTRIPTARSTRSCAAICTTGRERRAVSVQGGSVTPQVSPDGKTLAYRPAACGFRAIVYLRDLETGRDRQLFGNVDKDLQEAWAIHGLYPQYAWTPDGKSIVIWGEGKIWRVDVASRQGHADPVHRARRADAQRGGPLPAEGAPGRVPGAHAARRAGLARRQDCRLQRARPPLRRSALPDGAAEAR